MQLNVSCRVWSEFIAFLVSWRSSSTTAERWLNDASTFRASRLPYHTSRKLCCGCKSERRKTLPINFQLRLTRSRKNSRQLFLNKSLIMCCDKWFFAKKFPSLSHQLQVFTEARSRSHRANEKKVCDYGELKWKTFSISKAREESAGGFIIEVEFRHEKSGILAHFQVLRKWEINCFGLMRFSAFRNILTANVRGSLQISMKTRQLQWINLRQIKSPARFRCATSGVWTLILADAFITREFKQMLGGNSTDNIYVESRYYKLITA